jgi:Ser/Thr protein kinase RdoA (MazF antagonist)
MDAAAIARHFGLAGGARLSDGPVARGKQGEVWRLDGDAGSWAVKVPFDPDDEDDVEGSAAFQEAAYAAGVPTPAVRRTTDGSVFAGVGDRQVRVYEWVDLRAPDLRLDPSLVGAAVAAIHQVRTPTGGETHPWYTEPVGAAAWDDLVERLQTHEAPFADDLASLRDELVALEAWLEPPRTLRTCHRDLWADNVLPTASGGVCVIDWENSGPADPAQELGCVLFEFARGDPGRARELMAAYGAAGGPATLTGRGDFSMLIAQLGHITEIAARDWLEPNPRSPERADAEAWIREVLEEPHTRDVLDELLDAVSGRR